MEMQNVILCFNPVKEGISNYGELSIPKLGFLGLRYGFFFAAEAGIYLKPLPPAKAGVY